MANLINVTGLIPYNWSPDAVVAAEFSTSFSRHSEYDNGSGLLVARPKNGSWPVGVVLVPSSTYPGAFSPPSISFADGGKRPAMFGFTPNGPGSGTFNITASGPGINMTSTPTPTPAPAPTPTPTPAPAPTTQGNSYVTLTGVPSTIVAGQLLSEVTFSATAMVVFLVLYRVAGAADEGERRQSSLMSGNLTLLVPQTAGSYTIRAYDAAPGGNLMFESTPISVAAAPGPLPAQPTQTVDTGVTSTGATMNWTATAPNYRFLGRPASQTVYGSLVDTTLSTNSYTFTNRPAGSSPRAFVIPQNANGYGPPSIQMVSFLPA